MKAPRIFLALALAMVPTALLAVATWMPMPTTVNDYELPGSQPGDLQVDIEPSNRCSSCHGFYDEEIEAHSNWAGSMMAQSMRDPVFHAALAISEQDSTGSGDLCLRCHAPKGWLEGRATPSDGSALTGMDFDGINCNFCHRMVDPAFDPLENPAVDQSILASLSNPPSEAGGGMFVVDPLDRRRGPFDLGGNFWWHDWELSPFHQESNLCATCHDVSNPAFTRSGGAIPASTDSYDLNALDRPHPTAKKTDMFPNERTYSEWEQSSFGSGGVDMGGRYGGNKTVVSTCQDCHMPDLSGEGAAPGLGAIWRDDLPDHGFAGVNSWVPLAIHDLDLSLTLYGSSEASYVPEYLLQKSVDRNIALLQSASDLLVTTQGNQATARITNEAGHKLPSGYTEGRRMWMNVRFFNRQGALIHELGAYNTATAELDVASTKVYEAHIGPDANMAALSGHPAGPSFHFAFSNKIYFDNRIPPRGFNHANFEAVQAAPVGVTYADGQNWDETSFSIPIGTSWMETRVYHQTTTKEYIEFLRDENITNQTGQIAYDAWELRGKSAPVEMDFVGTYFEPHLSVTTFVAGQTTQLKLQSALPGATALFAYSLSGPGPTFTPYGWVDLDAPFQILPLSPINADGIAELSQTIPPAAAGVMVYLQAAEVGVQKRLSNSFAAVIQ